MQRSDRHLNGFDPMFPLSYPVNQKQSLKLEEKGTAMTFSSHVSLASQSFLYSTPAQASDDPILRTDWKAGLSATGGRGLVRLDISLAEQRRLHQYWISKVTL